MTHQRAARAATVLVTFAFAGCGGSAPPNTPPTSLATSMPTLAAIATLMPTTAVPFPPPGGAIGRIVFSAISPTATAADLYVMNADGSGEAKLAGGLGGNEPAWSPDGTRIAFVRDGIWVMHADGTQATVIRHVNGLTSDQPAWSPDGRQIAFIESAVCAPCSVGLAFAVNVMNADGSALRHVADAASDDRPAWSRDGQSLAFAGRLDDPPTTANGIQVIRLDGTGQHQLTDGQDSSPVWSSDGRLAFLRTTSTSADGASILGLDIAGEDGSAPQSIPLAFLPEAPLTWSPDGHWLAMAAAMSFPVHRLGDWEIFIIQPTGDGAMKLTNTTDRAEGFPSWH
jgi:Tol biopolymer transport system component